MWFYHLYKIYKLLQTGLVEVFFQLVTCPLYYYFDESRPCTRKGFSKSSTKIRITWPVASFCQSVNNKQLKCQQVWHVTYRCLFVHEVGPMPLTDGFPILLVCLFFFFHFAHDVFTVDKSFEPTNYRKKVLLLTFSKEPTNLQRAGRPVKSLNNTVYINYQTVNKDWVPMFGGRHP